MKHDWKITIVLKCGEKISGIFSSEHTDSGKVYDQIFKDITEYPNQNKWMTVLVNKTEVVSVKAKEIAAIYLQA